MAGGAIFFALAALLHFTDSGSGLTQNRRRQGRLDRCVSFIDFFQRQHHRLPTNAEFNQWTDHQLPGIPDTLNGFAGQSITYQTTNFSTAITDRFGPPPQHQCYTLDDWTGEGDAYYASWAKRSSLTLTPADYYLLGSPTAGGFAFLLLTALFIGAAWAVWPKRA